MKIINILILALLQVTVIPVVSALSSHQAPAVIRFVSTDNMTTIYKRPGAASYTPRGEFVRGDLAASSASADI